MSYRIKTVSDLTGIPRETILAWERRYGLVRPGRASNGYRSYSDDDVLVLQELKQLLDQGLQISEAIALREARKAEPPPPPPPPLQRPARADSELRDRILGPLLAFDRVGAEEAHRDIVPLSFRDRMDRIYAPMLHDVGDGWEAGDVSVAQEHFVTAYVREKVMAMLHSVSGGPETGRAVLCAGLPGETHELGLLQTAARLALAGMHVTYLGSELPADELVDVVKRTGIELVCQSAVMGKWRRDAVAYASALRPRLPAQTTLALGGPGVAGLDDSPLDGVLFCGTLDDLLSRWSP
jgi:DNA-binding transcriptional MerR regulator